MSCLKCHSAARNTLNRRKFIGLSGLAVTSAALAPRLTFSADVYGENILVFVFQRGGIDGLSFMAPMNGYADRGRYETLRAKGTMIPSAQLQPTADGWGLNPAAAPLLDLWSDNKLAIVQAVGLATPNRSHFEAERYIELGTPGNRFTTTGWLTRHLQTANNLPPSLVLPAVVTESTIRLSLLNEPSAVTLRYPGNFDLETGNNDYEELQEDALYDLYSGGGTPLDVAGAQALNAQSIVEAINWSGYVPANGAAYPTRPGDPTRLTSFGEEMKIMATLIKEDVGLRVAEADIGGWDTHTAQGNLSGGGFFNNVKDLSESLLAFMTDLDVPSPVPGKTWADRTTVIVFSEFGRRVFDNADAGTDHGSGNNMLALGGGVNGGRLYGNFLGLAQDQLFQKADVYTTTDFRTVLTECLLKRLHNDQIWQIFPGYSAQAYQPLGVFNGSLVQPDFNDPEIIFRSGLE
ncbi:MAG TPA: DUF1501 domain-containing protein [Xanthomonadales bacterium]|nr:DUF1501 domain-containing protein [Xanthomonadales bacterium]